MTQETHLNFCHEGHLLLKIFLIYPVVALYTQSVEMFLRSHLIMSFYCELQTMNNMDPLGCKKLL